jgi:hypothetical protein
MKHVLTASLSATSIFTLACLVTGAAVANGADANAQANQAQLHPWEANQTGWTPYGVPVGEVYPAAPGGFIGPNGYHPFGYDEVGMQVEALFTPARTGRLGGTARFGLCNQGRGASGQQASRQRQT